MKYCAARAVAAVSMSIIIGLVMAMIFRREDRAKLRVMTSAVEKEIAVVGKVPSEKKLEQIIRSKMRDN